MNRIIDNINTRRSVRLYEARTIPRNILQKIIDAGNAAPSGMNTQGWRFVVITDELARNTLAKLALPKYREMLVNAPEPFKTTRAVLDASVKDPVYYDAPAIIFVVGFGMAKDMNCPMVCQNMMLAARSLGIGSCWVYMGQLAAGHPDFNALLELKDGESIYGPVVFGYPKDGQFPPMPPKKAAVVKWA
jgi:nitroreductase